ncbi:phage major capsid protein [Sphingomonas sp. Leaf37]|uniref:phage major capsid protein n=1 Tax=Sphingomonas sp. Leaf37 TaxID=2876552 RepID=UPI001E332F23|nr:phage major capsid protein [Sphingomonas sp. Leaf37]
MSKTMLLAAASAAVLIGPMSAIERQRGRYMRNPEGHGNRPDPQASLQALRTRRSTAVASMQALIDAAEADDRELTAEETAQYDTLAAEATGLKTRIDRVADVAAANASLDASTGSIGRGQRPQRGPEARTSFDSLGEFMSAVRFRPNDQRLSFIEGIGTASDDTGEMSAEMRMDNGPSGGFMIPTEFRDTIMSVPPQSALVRPRATIIAAGDQPDASLTMGALDQSGTGPGSQFGGMTFKWIGEGDQKPETDMKLREVTLTPHEIAGFITVTDKLLRNWTGATTFLETQMRAGVAAAEDWAFLRGDGISKPLGALNAGATKFVNRKLANRVTYEDLVAMEAVCLMRGDTSPVWSIPQSVLPQLRTMTDPAGHYIWVASTAEGAAKTGYAGTLLGYPVRWNNRAPQLGGKGDILLADWSYYLVKDGAGPFVAASEHVLFTSNKTVIKIFWNVDGTPWLTKPISEANGYEVSPFVGLDVPA